MPVSLASPYEDVNCVIEGQLSQTTWYCGLWNLHLPVFWSLAKVQWRSDRISCSDSVMRPLCHCISSQRLCVKWQMGWNVSRRLRVAFFGKIWSGRRAGKANRDRGRTKRERLWAVNGEEVRISQSMTHECRIELITWYVGCVIGSGLSMNRVVEVPERKRAIIGNLFLSVS